MSEKNKAVVQRIYEVINSGNLAQADNAIAFDVVEHEEFPGSDQGLEGFKQFFGMLRSAFPDLKFTVEDVVSENEKVVVRVTMNGTHNGEFMGIPATGKHIRMSGIDIMRVVDGKIVEHWGNSDQLGMMQQLGITPAAN